MRYLLVGDEIRRAGFLTMPGLPAPVGASLAQAPEKGSFGVIDLHLDERPAQLRVYEDIGAAWVIGGAASMPVWKMKALAQVPAFFPVLGLNTLPGFLERPHWEATVPMAARELYDELTTLGIPILTVPDRTGMVTPRVLFPIFNECFLMVQQGVVTPAGLDKAMRLGVNYPNGPLAWAESCGLGQVVRVLDALFEETADPRYRVCEALRVKAMEEALS